MVTDPAVLATLDAYFAELSAKRAQADRKDNRMLRSVAAYNCRRHLLVAFKLLREAAQEEPASTLRSLLDEGYASGRGEDNE